MISFHLRYKILKLLSFLLLFDNYLAEESPEINILFINESENIEASDAIETIVDYAMQNSSLGFTINVTQVEGDQMEPKTFLRDLCDVYSKSVENDKPPHIVLDMTKTPVMSEIAKKFTSVLALPTISGAFGRDGDIHQWRDINNDNEKRKYFLQVMPPMDVIPEVIRSIVVYMNMTNAAILFDKTFVFDHKYKTLLHDIKVRKIVTQMKNNEQISKLRKLYFNNYFILGSLENVKSVLEKVPSEYFGRDFAWHVITQDLGNLTCNCGNVSIMFVRPMQPFSFYGLIQQNRVEKTYTDIGSTFYFDLTLRALLTVKKMISTKNWPEKMSYLTCDNYNGSNTPKRTLDLKSFFVNESEPPTYGAFKLANDNMSFNGHSRMEFDMDILSVSFRNGISYEEHILGDWKAGFTTPFRIKDTNKILEVHKPTPIYRVASTVKPPFIIRDNTTKRGYRGFSIDMMDVIATLQHFEYIIVEADQHGRLNENGTWNGIVRLLMDKEVDIGLGAMQIMAERESVIDFTIPYYDLVGYTVLMANPRPKQDLFKFLTVLDTNVWYCILGAYFFTSTLMYIFDRLSPYSYQNNKEKYADDDEKKVFTMRECLWFCITSITPQGGGEAPKNLSGRLVAATWWLFGFIVIASYTANLAAFLTVSRLETPIENLDDLAKQYKILYAPIKGSEAMTYFERMSQIEDRFYEMWKELSLNDSLTALERSKLAVWDYPISDKYTKMWHAMQEAGLPNTLDEAVQRIRNSTNSVGFALVGDASDIRYLEMTSCDLKILGDEFSRKPYALAVQKDSPLKEGLDAALLKMLNDRSIKRLKKYWMTKKQKCAKFEDKQDGIPVSNIGGVFVVIIFGIVLAIFTLIFEYFWFKYLKKSAKYSSQASYSSSLNAYRTKNSDHKHIRFRTISHN